MERYKGVYKPQDTYGFFEQDNLVWQAYWYNENSLNQDKYERGGFYASEAEAFEGAIMGKQNQDTLAFLAQQLHPLDSE